ncbi:MAG: GDSL family lipase [Opitutaceae bacterium]|nr:GDSL family lipase [Opitutaceae bacterium]
MRRRCFAATLIAAATSIFGQTGQAPAASPAPVVNRLLVPVPRNPGASHEKARNRFIELNQRVKESQGKAEVIFIGDSITMRWEESVWTGVATGKEVWAKYYAHRHALNLGIGGDGIQNVLWRLDHGNLDGLSPKVAVVLIGVNNIPSDDNTPRMVLEGVTAVVQKLREKLPETKIILLGIFPFREDFNLQRAKAMQVNQALHKLDDGQWIHFLDFGHLFIQPDGRISKDMMPDFLHLSPAGYHIWAEAMEPKLAALLGDQPVTP